MWVETGLSLRRMVTQAIVRSHRTCDQTVKTIALGIFVTRRVPLAHRPGRDESAIVGQCNGTIHLSRASVLQTYGSGNTVAEMFSLPSEYTIIICPSRHMPAGYWKPGLFP